MGLAYGVIHLVAFLQGRRGTFCWYPLPDGDHCFHYVEPSYGEWREAARRTLSEERAREDWERFRKKLLH